MFFTAGEKFWRKKISYLSSTWDQAKKKAAGRRARVAFKG